MSVRVPEEMRDRARAKAWSEGFDLSEMVRDWIESYGSDVDEAVLATWLERKGRRVERRAARKAG